MIKLLLSTGYIIFLFPWFRGNFVSTDSNVFGSISVSPLEFGLIENSEDGIG